ncbi:MAG: TadE/TadG family type IV pilus assembly protein [Vicinamibacterales bacterium]
MHSTRRGRIRSEKGAELVEMAFVLPLFLLLIAGIVDFGFLLQGYLVSANAAREGARVAMLPGYDADDYAAAKERVVDYFASAGLTLDTDDVDVTEEDINLGSGDTANGVRVTVSYTHNFLLIGPIVGLMNLTFMDSLTYTTDAVMRTEVQG